MDCLNVLSLGTRERELGVHQACKNSARGPIILEGAMAMGRELPERAGGGQCRTESDFRVLPERDEWQFPDTLVNCLVFYEHLSLIDITRARILQFGRYVFKINFSAIE
jgi:hypothetical protein